MDAAAYYLGKRTTEQTLQLQSGFVWSVGSALIQTTVILSMGLVCFVMYRRHVPVERKTIERSLHEVYTYEIIILTIADELGCILLVLGSFF